MKNLTFVFCILASGILTSQDISFTNKENQSQSVIFVNGEYLQNGLAYTGKYTIYFDNGKIKEEFNIKDGKLNGGYLKNHENGTKMDVGSYENNLKFGLWSRYITNGKLIAQASYANDKKDGNWYVYNEEGNKVFEMIYKDGEKTGIWKQWDENGKLVKSIDYSSM